MTRARTAPRLPIARFGRREDGSMAVEFALIAPVLLFLFFGMIELTDAIAAKRRVTMAVSTMADLVTNSRDDWIHADGVEDVLDATAAVLQPYGIEQAVTRLTCVTWDDTEKKQIVVWSVERTGAGSIIEPTGEGYKRGDHFTSLGAKQVLDPVEEMVSPDYHMIVGEISYPYDPPLGHLLGTFDIEQREARLPRREEYVHYCESNRPGPDCTDGRNYDETEGRPVSP